MRSLILVSLILVQSAVAYAQTTVRKSDGQTIKGEIKGFLVQRGEDVDGATKTISYHLIPGDAIMSISEEGVNILPGRTLKVVVVRQNPPKDDEFNLTFAENFLDMPSDVNMNISGVGQMAVRTFTGKNLTDRIIGEFRLDGKQRRLSQDVQVITTSETISIPASDLVRFRPPK